MTSASDWTHSASSRQLIIRFAGEIDDETAHHLRRTLARAAPGPVGRVLVDLSEVPFMDTTGLGVLVEAKARLGDRLWLRGITPQVRELMRITGLLESLGVSGPGHHDPRLDVRPPPLSEPAPSPDLQRYISAGATPADPASPSRVGPATDPTAAGPTRNDQAVRILAEAYGCDPEEAWQMLFRASRSHAVQVHELTHAVVETAWGHWRSDRSRETTGRALESLMPAELRNEVPTPREGSDDVGYSR